MKFTPLILAATALLTIAGIAYAGQRNPAPRPKPQPVVALLILENPGKDGVIWSVGFDLTSQVDINRRVRVKDQTEAEKMVALLQETAPGRYRFAGLVRI
jgi:hypothetical protein